MLEPITGAKNRDEEPTSTQRQKIPTFLEVRKDLFPRIGRKRRTLGVASAAEDVPTKRSEVRQVGDGGGFR